MSLIPLLYSNWWEDLEHPHSLLDQHFGHGIYPDNSTYTHRRHHPSSYLSLLAPRSTSGLTSRCPATSMYIRPWADLLRQDQGGVSTVKADKDSFQVSLDVQQFAPEEIDVKVVDKMIVVEGKHEEKQDEHGWISRQFSRRYIVPEQCDIDQVVSKLSSDGVLSITVPRKELPKVTNERSIKIEHTGKPAVRENGEVKSVKNSEAAKEAEK
ncbi:protein lethal(2)essential for life-like [Venturia canescens]|uniref:protein lethal(2)essential for life-like n=1 Tax=Venturia canescens TaxID=32260 RepID=UPI001C9D37D8|nr:protein lethal(2)essential for life-like [Venturia canescens]